MIMIIPLILMLLRGINFDDNVFKYNSIPSLSSSLLLLLSSLVLLILFFILFFECCFKSESSIRAYSDTWVETKEITLTYNVSKSNLALKLSSFSQHPYHMKLGTLFSPQWSILFTQNTTAPLETPPTHHYHNHPPVLYVQENMKLFQFSIQSESNGIGHEPGNKSRSFNH